MQSSNETVQQSHVTGGDLGNTDIGEILIEKEVVAAGGLDQEEAELLMASHPMDLSNFLTRSTRIATGLLQATDTPYFNLLGSTFDPIGLFLANTYIAGKLKEFTWLRTDIEVVMTLTVPSNAYGLYNLQALCEGGSTGTAVEIGGAYADNVWTSFQDIHCVIDITKSTTVRLTLPWVFALDAGTIGGTTVWPWRLCLWPLQPIRNAMNTDVISGTYNIYARMMPGYELGWPTMQSGKGKKPDFKGSMMKNVVALKESKAISKGSAKLAGAAAMIGTAVPFLAPFAASAAAGLASVSTIADYFGFTRESKPLEPMPMVLRSINNLANVDGYDTGDIVALYNNNSTTIDPRIGGGLGEDETSIASLYARETIVDTFAWTLAATAGTVLREIPVTPFFCNNVLGAYYPIVAGYVGLPFSYWRGGMRYHVYIPSSVYHRGMLQIYWSPVRVTIASDLTNVLFNAIVDVTNSSEIEVVVPYAMSNLCLSNTGLFGPTNYASAAGNVTVNGFLYFVVANQLQTVGAAGDIQIFLTAVAEPDMRFGVPIVGNHFLADSGTTQPMGFIWQLQGGALDEGGEDMEIVNILGGGDTTKAYPVEDVLWGEVFGSVRSLMQRMSYVGMSVASVNQEARAFPHFFPPVAPNQYVVAPTAVVPVFDNGPQTQNRPQWTWLSHYASMFVGLRGSTRYKVVTTQPNRVIMMNPVRAKENLLTASGFEPPGNHSAVITLGASASSLQNVGAGCGAEFLVPYYDIQKYWIYRWVANQLSGGTTRLDLLTVNPTVAGASNVDVLYYYVGGGPDIAPIRFRRTPALVIYA